MADETGPDSAFPDDIDHYPAGPELDAILAARVLGARVRRYTEGWTGYENWIAFTPDGGELYILLSPHSVYGAAPLWNPSANVSDAQVLVQHLYAHSDYRTMTDEVTGDNGYSATLWQQPPTTGGGPGTRSGKGLEPPEVHSVTGYGPTRALAVCRAVYKAASEVSLHRVDDPHM